MRERKKRLLDYTIRTYIKTASPVGSSFLAEKYGLGVSSATVRNDLMELESEGYIFQPHISSGRVPTETGYRFWIENFYREKVLGKDNRNKLKNIKNDFESDNDRTVKEFAKCIASFSNSAVVVGFSPDDIYYTGISYLFSQPEFHRYELVCSISEVVDRLDDIIPDFFDNLDDNVDILIGKDNPLSNDCSVVISGLEDGRLFMILGPTRMDYENNVAIIKFLKKLI